MIHQICQWRGNINGLILESINYCRCLPIGYPVINSPPAHCDPASRTPFLLPSKVDLSDIQETPYRSLPILSSSSPLHRLLSTASRQELIIYR